MSLFKLDDHLAAHSHRIPSHTALLEELIALITTAAPPFVYVYDPTSPRLTATVIRDLIAGLPNTHYVALNATTTFTARLVYDSIINSLAGHIPSWESGCRNWDGDSPNARWNENLDGFLYGLRMVEQDIYKRAEKVKGKSRQADIGGAELMVIVVESAEKLDEHVPELIVTLSRLRELSMTNVTVVFTSTARWEDIRPELGAAMEPYHVDVVAPSKEDLVKQLVTAYPSLSHSLPPKFCDPGTYHGSLEALYKQYVSSLVDVCYATTRNPDEITYIAAACWPGYVKPVLDLFYSLEGDISWEKEQEVSIMPDENTRLRLLKLLTPTFHSALQVLLPRSDHASFWADQNRLPDNILSLSNGYKIPAKQQSDEKQEDDELMTLPKMAKYILLASYIASTNPARTDRRMFERGTDEKLRKRRIRGPSKKKAATNGQPDKESPAPFSVDRLLAILGALLENNDADTRLQELEFEIAGEETDMEVARVGISGLLSLLVSLRLLHRNSAAEKLDGATTLKCGISYETALGISRQLRVDLADMIWEAT